MSTFTYLYLLIALFSVVVCIRSIGDWGKDSSLVNVLTVLVCSFLWPVAIGLGLYLKFRK